MVSLFGIAGTREELPARITELVRVPVDDRDGLPASICQQCKRRVVPLEKAVQGLADFRKQCQQTYQDLVLSGEPVTLKRTKESSGDVGVSPDIARYRPPLKKQSKAARSLSFDSGMPSYSFIMQLVNIILIIIFSPNRC